MSEVGAWHLFGNIRGVYCDGQLLVFEVEINYSLPFRIPGFDDWKRIGTDPADDDRWALR